jgi:hypothetical protein
MTRTLADTLKNIHFAKICVHTVIFLKILVSQSFCIRSARKSLKNVAVYVRNELILRKRVIRVNLWTISRNVSRKRHIRFNPLSWAPHPYQAVDTQVREFCRKLGCRQTCSKMRRLGWEAQVFWEGNRCYWGWAQSSQEALATAKQWEEY